VSAHGDAHTDLAASFEDAVADVILDRMEQAITIFKKHYPNKKAHIVTGGGVAANKTIKARLADWTSRHQMIFTAPPSSLCTDNGAMIAWAGLQRLNRGLINSLDMKARPRWPLEELKKEFQPQRRRDTEVLIKC
jgi:N6-L-threonylcarbamoyladenine synthase